MLLTFDIDKNVQILEINCLCYVSTKYFLPTQIADSFQVWENEYHNHHEAVSLYEFDYLSTKSSLLI